jgi:hypothetical protein
VTEPILTRASVTCPHCEQQHEIALLQDGARVAVLNPVGEETVGGLVSEFMGDRWRQRVREEMGS